MPEPQSALPPPPSEQPRARPRSDRRGIAAIVLVVLGLLLWLGYRLAEGSEGHAYVEGATPPSDYALTAGDTYSISVPGGVDRADFPAVLSCSVTPAGGESATVEVTREGDGSRALNQIGRFVAPTSGRAAVSCSTLPPVFVDDADDTGLDLAGLCLVLACLALAVGLPLLLSSLRTSSSGSDSASPPWPMSSPTSHPIP